MKYLIAALFLAVFPFTTFAKGAKQEPVPCFIPRPANMVPDRTFVETDLCPEWPISERKQYAPLNSDIPLFEESRSEATYVGGAFYREEKDLQIVVEPDYATTSETIEEDEGASPIRTEHSS